MRGRGIILEPCGGSCPPQPPANLLELVLALRTAQVRVAHAPVVGEAARVTEAALPGLRDPHERGGPEAALDPLALLLDRLGLRLGGQRRLLLARRADVEQRRGGEPHALRRR